MMSSQLSLNAIVSLCRGARHGLAAGLSLVDVFRQQARNGPTPLRPVAERVQRRLERGDSLEDALKAEAACFPPMFLSLAGVGESAGRLPEVFRQLEHYYALQRRLIKQFRSDMIWPMFEFFGAIVVIFLMLLILQMIGTGYNPIGIGPFQFLGFAVGGVALIAAAYLVVTRVMNQAAAFHRLLLRVPGVGPCVEAFALLRFCLGLHMTMEAGLSVPQALRRSFAATSNPAYEAAAEDAVTAVKSGDDLTVALERSRVFPEDFIHVVAVAEEGGVVPERMAQQAEYYEEEASRRLAVLTRFASIGVWCFVALLIIVAIFRIAMKYIGIIDGLAGGDLSVLP